jgi:hypothetical protein
VEPRERLFRATGVTGQPVAPYRGMSRDVAHFGRFEAGEGWFETREIGLNPGKSCQIVPNRIKKIPLFAPVGFGVPSQHRKKRGATSEGCATERQTEFVR